MPETEEAPKRTGGKPAPEPPLARKPGPKSRLRGWLGRLPLERRLTALHFLLSGTLVIMVTLGLITWLAVGGYLEARRDVTETATMAAEAIRLSDAQHSDPGTALLPFLRDESVQGIGLFNEDLKLVAKAEKGTTTLAEVIANATTEGVRGAWASVHDVQRVYLSENRRAFLVTEITLMPMWRRTGMAAVLGIAIAAITYVIMRRVHARLAESVIHPFEELKAVVNAIPADGQFEDQLEPPRDPELGSLVTRLNELFNELHQRQIQLNDAKLDLELNVLTRTSELQQQIEDRKKAEVALRESEARYRNLFENNPMPMFVMDQETTRFLAVNQAALRHYGYSGKEFSGLTLKTLTHPEEAGNVLRAFGRDAHSADAGEWRHLRKNGDAIEVQLTAHTIHFSGHVAKIILANDVTERNRAERAFEELNKKLIETSRQAGMAEVATGVLHNVGNVLNSVNVSAAVLAESIDKSRAAGIRKVAQLLEANQENLAAFFGPEGKGRLLIQYVQTLGAQIEEERQMHLRELALLTKNVTHIKQIVAAQQTHAKVRGMMEPQPVRELVDEALRLAESDLAADGVRTVIRAEDGLNTVFTDRHKVLQILVNLIANARQAMSELPRDKRVLIIAIEPGNDGRVCIRIKDRGCGIPHENMTRIFHHGFTTKVNGHGFGLHGAANAARELSGNLLAQSDGPGQGATFTVELPGSREIVDTKTETNERP